MANLLLFLLPAILALLLPQPAAAIRGPNYLLTGQTLRRANSLSLVQQDYVLTMQEDCNLVLSNRDRTSLFWHTNITGSRDCSLNLNDYGQLYILHPNGNILWRTNHIGTNSGMYAAVLHPLGKLVIYGPVLWHTTPSSPPSSEGFGSTPRVANMLFPEQVLNEGEKVQAKKDIYMILDDCNLALHDGLDITWQSNTTGKGEYCFARLSHHGELIISDDDGDVKWRSNVKSTPEYSDHVLIVSTKPYGQGIVYGPDIWSSQDSKLERAIRMVTSRKVAK